MRGWFKRKAPPATCKANPGQGIRATIAFANAERSWTEVVDIMACMEDALRLGGYTASPARSWIELASGLILQPRLVSFQPLEPGGVQTVTTTEVSHPSGIPAGVFEYQHSTGEDTRHSVTRGFESWMRADLPVFLDALGQGPQQCSFLQFEWPAESASRGRKRRVVLGPVSHLVSAPTEDQAEEHPFCPCCLFTRIASVLKPKVSDDAFYGIRLFALRDQDGAAGADCRLNGEDWEPGRAALIEYVRSWPDRGMEFRKQYVVVQNQPGETPGG